MLDLFSGIGGFSLAARWTGKIETVAFCEKDSYCKQVLEKNFPGIPIQDDIKKLTNEGQYGAIDIITGGFPCQPFSIAGKQRGKEDDRYLWPEMLRVIKEFRPTWVIGENVAGLVSMGIEKMLSDLEAQGYRVQLFIIPACAVNAHHRRDRVWIVANNEIKADREHNSGEEKRQKSQSRESIGRNDVPNSKSIYAQGQQDRSRKGEFRGGCWWPAEPDVGRVAHGIPRRVDRLKGLGNAIVPQVAYEILNNLEE